MLYFVTPEPNTFPGVSRLFEETIAVVGGEHIYLRDIHKITRDDIAIFGAWHPQYSTAIRRVKAKKKIIEFSSPLLQQELSGVESYYLATILNLLERKIIDGVWFVDRNNYELFKNREGVFYTPHPVSIESLAKFAPPKNIKKNNIAMFFPWCSRKNILTQLGAVAILEKHSIKVHGNNIPNIYKDFASRLGVNIVDHGWMPKEDYYDTIKEMYLGLHVTLSEAFGYGVVDFLCCGRPTLISESIAENLYIYPESDVYDYLVVKKADDASEIAEKIKGLHDLKEKEYNKLCDQCLAEVEATAWVNNKEVKIAFEKHF